MADNNARKTHQRQAIDERLDELRRRGILVPSVAPRQTLKPVARRPGSLARFLAGRGK